MRNPLLLTLALILIVGLLAACGGAATEDEEAPAPTVAPAATATQAPTATTAPTPTTAAAAPTPTTAAAAPAATEEPEAMSALEEYAAMHAGGPGAIYVGDITQLVGPAPSESQGDFDGNVTLESLERHIWVYESDIYRELLDKARLTDPTPLESSGESITIQHACINRALLPCQLLETYFTPNLSERTNGQVEFVVSSFPELGLAGPDTLSLVSERTLDSANIYGGYVAGELPPVEIQNLWGIYESREQEFEATQAIIKDIEDLVLSETGGVIMNHNWFSGNDQFFFCHDKIDSIDGVRGQENPQPQRGPVRLD